MRRLSMFALAAVLSTMAGAAPRQTDAARLSRELAGRTPGRADSCITLRDIRSSAGFTDPDTILYRLRSGVLAVNRPAGGCNLRGDPILVTQTPSTRLCRGDIVTLVDRTSRFPVGSCGLSDFVPYPRPPLR